MPTTDSETSEQLFTLTATTSTTLPTPSLERTLMGPLEWCSGEQDLNEIATEATRADLLPSQPYPSRLYFHLRDSNRPPGGNLLDSRPLQWFVCFFVLFLSFVVYFVLVVVFSISRSLFFSPFLWIRPVRRWITESLQHPSQQRDQEDGYQLGRGVHDRSRRPLSVRKALFPFLSTRPSSLTPTPCFLI